MGCPGMPWGMAEGTDRAPTHTRLWAVAAAEEVVVAEAEVVVMAGDTP